MGYEDRKLFFEKLRQHAIDTGIVVWCACQKRNPELKTYYSKPCILMKTDVEPVTIGTFIIKNLGNKNND